MTDEQAKELVLELANAIDYDAAKYYDPECSEEPEEGQRQLRELITIVKQHVSSWNDVGQFLVSEPKLPKKGKKKK